MRLFLGTRLSDDNQRFYAEFARAVVKRHRDVIHGVPVDSAHLTYLFAADAADECLESLATIVRQRVATMPAFDIELGPLRILQVGPRPRLICADVVKGAFEVAALACDLLHSVEQAHLPLTASGSKSPHVTLARFSKQARRSDARAVALTLERGVWASDRRADRIAHIQIIVSTLTPAGPVYEARAQCALA